MDVRAPRRAIGPPIALQIMALLLAGIVAAYGLSFAVVVLVPPPRPPVWRIAEIAGALQNGPLKLRDGRVLTREIDAAAPPEGDERMRGGPWRTALAMSLNLPIDQVRLSQTRREGNFIMGDLPDLLSGRRPPGEGPGRGERYEHFMAPGGRPPPGDAHFEGRFDNRFGGRLDGPGGPSPEVRRAMLERMILVGDFAAGVRLPDGRWQVVSSPPEPFPSDWQWRVMLWFGGCLVVIGLAAYLFGRRITAPISRFAEAADRLGLDPRQGALPLSGPAEIGKAASAFNRMQERLKRYVDDRTAMVAAISHDMRTPLARIRFKIEDAPESVKAAVTKDVERMEGMIDAVLAFVRDASEPSRRERLDLRSLVEVVADEALETEVPVDGEERPVVVDGDPSALTRLFANLVDNALKHGGGARIHVSRDAENGYVAVIDDGPGVPAAELERVFQPFYRADPARTLTRDGVGLGLAVARSIARAHGGDVTLEPRSPTGLIARVTLPLAAKR